MQKNNKHPFESAHSIGPKMVKYLKQIGVNEWTDLDGVEAEELAMRIEVETGGQRLNRLGLQALENLIERAKTRQI